MISAIRSVVLGAGLCGAALSAQTLAPSHYPEYHLTQSDVIEVKFRYTPEFDQIVTVRPDGRVTLEATGTFVAADLTLDDFKAEVAKLSTKRLVDADVSVVLKEFQKPSVMVEGEVTNPGRVELKTHLSAMDAIAMAGGFKLSSKQSRVLLMRYDPNSPGTTRVLDLKALVSKNKLEEAPQLWPGDVIYVTQNGLSKVERLAHMGSFGAIYSPYR
jgi:polysaccharide export outer membrane protein